MVPQRVSGVVPGGGCCVTFRSGTGSCRVTAMLCERSWLSKNQGTGGTAPCDSGVVDLSLQEMLLHKLCSKHSEAAIDL